MYHEEYTMHPNPQNKLAITATLLVADLKEIIEQRAEEATEELYTEPTPFDVDVVADQLFALLHDYLRQRKPSVNQLTIPHAACHFGVKLEK